MKLTEITVSRMIPAPQANVFDVWMDPESPGGLRSTCGWARVTT